MSIFIAELYDPAFDETFEYRLVGDYCPDEIIQIIESEYPDCNLLGVYLYEYEACK